MCNLSLKQRQQPTKLSHLTDVLPVVIQLEQQEEGAADDQQRQNGSPVHAKHPETMYDDLLCMT